MLDKKLVSQSPSQITREDRYEFREFSTVEEAENFRELNSHFYTESPVKTTDPQEVVNLDKPLVWQVKVHRW